MATGAYGEILSALDSVPWHRAHEVTPIRPIFRKHINFFPGHAGHAATNFPIGGIMAVGNNFSNLAGWREYETGLDRESASKTWRRLRLMVDASGQPIETWWFTNYCLGVMDSANQSYVFPRRVIGALRFDLVFARFVAIMRPRLIVSLGRPASGFLQTNYQRQRVDVRTIGGHTTRLLAAVHPSAWTWRRKRFSDEDFILEGQRIGLEARNGQCNLEQ